MSPTHSVQKLLLYWRGGRVCLRSAHREFHSLSFPSSLHSLLIFHGEAGRRDGRTYIPIVQRPVGWEEVASEVPAPTAAHAHSSSRREEERKESKQPLSEAPCKQLEASQRDSPVASAAGFLERRRGDGSSAAPSRATPSALKPGAVFAAAAAAPQLSVAAGSSNQTSRLSVWGRRRRRRRRKS